MHGEQLQHSAVSTATPMLRLSHVTVGYEV